MIPKISFFASAIKSYNWKKVLDSLKSNKYFYEVVFSGYLENEFIKETMPEYPELRYITTDNIKPAQCYEVARRNCTGELVCWMDDDHIFSEGFVDKAYDYWKSLHNYKAIVATKFIEKESEDNVENFRFYARNKNTPQMPLIGIMSREYLEELGGLDSRYIKSRWMCDIAMRALADGGKIYVFKDVYATLDSANKNGLYNNFWSGWNEDSEQLENSWVIGGYKRFPDPLLVLGSNVELQVPERKPYWYIPIQNDEVTLKRNDEFHPFKEKFLLKSSEYPYGFWFPTLTEEQLNG